MSQDTGEVRQMLIGTISTKGQITLPAYIRKKLGINSGDKILFEETPEGFSLKKADSLLALKGCLGKAVPPEDEQALFEKHAAGHVMGTHP